MNKTKLVVALSYLWKENRKVVSFSPKEVHKILYIADYVSLNHNYDYLLTGIIFEDTEEVTDFLNTVELLDRKTYLGELSGADMDNLDQAVNIYESYQLYVDLSLDIFGIFSKQEPRELLKRLGRSEEEIDDILSVIAREEYLNKLLK